MKDIVQEITTLENELKTFRRKFTEISGADESDFKLLDNNVVDFEFQLQQCLGEFSTPAAKTELTRLHNTGQLINLDTTVQHIIELIVNDQLDPTDAGIDVNNLLATVKEDLTD